MILFSALAALLVGLTLSCLLPPLLRAPHSAAPAPQPALWSPVMLGLYVPAVALSLYFALGAPAGLVPAAHAAAPESAHQIGGPEIENMVNGLARRLEQNPDDLNGWRMLGRSYHALGRYGEAANVYARLREKLPDNADILADHADSVAMWQGKQFQGEPEKLIAAALKLDPKHLKALSLSASAAFARADYAQAILAWQKVLTLVPPDSEDAQATQDSIAQAQSRLSGAAPAKTESTPAPAPSAGVSGRIELDPALRTQLSDHDTVFVFARAVGGPPMPLAILRKQAKDLPFEFTMNDAMSMMPGLTISKFKQVTINARISKSGNATPSKGDLIGNSGPVANDQQGLRVRIDQVLQK